MRYGAVYVAVVGAREDGKSKIREMVVVLDTAARPRSTAAHVPAFGPPGFREHRMAVVSRLR
jgi:hypothetical protein